MNNNPVFRFIHEGMDGAGRRFVVCPSCIFDYCTSLPFYFRRTLIRPRKIMQRPSLDM